MAVLDTSVDIGSVENEIENIRHILFTYMIYKTIIGQLYYAQVYL